MGELEASGFQFLKDKQGWACFDDDTRVEVPGSRHKYLGEAVWLAAKHLGVEK